MALKRTIPAVLLAATAGILAGCEQEIPYNTEAVKEEASALAMEDIAKDKLELADKVKELQKVDPSVKEAFYSVNDKGEKVLNIIREEANGTQSSSLWPLVGGMAAGALMANMMSSGGMNNYARQNPSSVYPGRTYKDEEDKRRHMSSAGGGYYNTMYNRASNTVRSPSYSPKFSPAMKNTFSARQTAAFSSSSSARSSSHSGSSAS